MENNPHSISPSVSKSTPLPSPVLPSNKPPLGETIVNLSSRDLSNIEKQILDKGLKFIPTPSINSLEEIVESTERFERLIKIKYFFRDKQIRGERIPFVEKSDWTPPNLAIRNDILNVLEKMKNDINKLPIVNERYNLSRQERTALNLLRKDHSIIIKKSDKGSCCVILNREDYIAEAEKQLSNKKHYKQLDEPIYLETAQMINSVLSRLVNRRVITEKQFQYLCAPNDCRQRHLYTLPKIHKNPETECFLPNKIPKGRPII